MRNKVTYPQIDISKIPFWQQLDQIAPGHARISPSTFYQGGHGTFVVLDAKEKIVAITGKNGIELFKNHFGLKAYQGSKYSRI